MKTRKIIALLITTLLALTFCISAYAFSDEYEPYYPHITAVTRSTDEIYQRISSPDNVLPEEVVKARREMIEMYKSVGIDVSLDMETFLCSYRMISDFPQRWSKETPIPLGESADYSGAFSIDAPWNNKIPADAPRVYLPPTALNPKLALAVVKADVDTGGYGTGIPQLVATSADPYITIAAKYDTGNVNKIFMFHAREDFRKYINNAQVGDEHILFIDSETQTAVQTWASRVQGDSRGYKLKNGALPDYTVRGGSAGIEYRLDGIGAEGQTGINAANTPTNAYTVKSSEVSSTTEMFNHAIGGAIGQLICARVFPTVSVDAGHYVVDGKATNHQDNVGVVPYGGVIQLDPELDIDSIYKAGKLSFHAYRIFKCMQEYGYYNIDTSEHGGKGGMLMYTSTYSKDWKNPDFAGFNVPYKDNEQGFDKVKEELQAFLAKDWGWFGLSEQPKLYLTVPVVKYADLDVNDDGAIDQTDYDLVAQHAGEAYSDTNKQYDVNQDKEISPADIEIMYNYLNDLPAHTFTWHDVSFADNDDVHGRIVGSGTTRKENGAKQYRDGMMASFGIDAENGWEFAGWTGDFAKYGTQPVVKVVMDRSYTIGAKYKKKPEIKFTAKVNGPGHIELSETGITYDSPKSTYGKDTLVSLKAVADEGYEFLGWAGDLTGFTNPMDVLLTKDTEAIALFGKTGYVDPFNPEEWEFVSGGADAYTVNAGKNITFNSNAFDYSKQIIINKNTKKNINLDGDFSIRINMKAPNIGDTLHARLLFNYKDAKNYYYVGLGGKGLIEVGKIYKGVETVLKTIPGNNEIVKNGVIFKPQMDLEVIKKGSYLYVNGYKDGEMYEYCKVREKSLKGGTIGVGGKWNGVYVASNIVVSNNVVDAEGAKLQTWTKSGRTDPWLAKLDKAVVVAADSDKAYAGNDYTKVSADGSVKPYYANDGETVYVPLRYVTEKLGGKVVYDPATDSVIASYGEHSASFKAWTNGAQEVNGTLYVPAKSLADALGKEFYQYNAVVFFSDKPNVYTPSSEPECQEFIKTAFEINYYM